MLGRSFKKLIESTNVESNNGDVLEHEVLKPETSVLPKMVMNEVMDRPLQWSDICNAIKKAKVG